MSSRDRILKKLRRAQMPFTDVAPRDERLHMTPMADTSPEALRARFIAETEALGCKVYPCDYEEAIEQIKTLVGEDGQVLSWEHGNIPIEGLHAALAQSGVSIAAHDDGDVRVGITGVDAALAATGSLVLLSGDGQFRYTSLLPDCHIAVLKADRIVPNLEAWFDTHKGDDYTAFRASSNVTVISGPSKTADIAQELVKGAHGPREVHIILLQ